MLVPRIFFSSLSALALPSADPSVPYPTEGLHIDSGRVREVRMGNRCFGCILPASCILFMECPIFPESLPAQCPTSSCCDLSYAGWDLRESWNWGTWVELGGATASLIQGSLGERL